MTERDLFEQIRHLGGRRSLTGLEDSVIFTAVNRALFEVNRLFPVTKKIQLLNYPIAPVNYYKGVIVHKGGADKQFNASGVKSLAFAVSGGAGSATVYTEIDEEIRQLTSFSWQQLSEFEECKYIIQGAAQDVYIVFSGEYTYMIRDLAFYGEVISDELDDVITCSSWIEYDMKNSGYAGEGFLDFAAKPVSINDGATAVDPSDYKIEGSKIYLRRDMMGTYEVSYLKNPKRITNLNSAEQLDIEPQLHDLVALRAAYYLYNVTDTEIADRLNAEYQKALAIALGNVRKVRTPSKFKNVLKGW